MKKKYYRPKELAVYLGVGIATIWRYAKQGKITPKKLSDKVTVFDIDDIQSLFNPQVTH